MKSHYCPEEKGIVHYEVECNWCVEKEMNADKLLEELDLWADLYKSYRPNDENMAKDAANMLRQQADRIAHLEMLVANRNEIIDKLDLSPQKQSEPVAWMTFMNDEEDDIWYEEPKDLPEGYTYKPLYTTPQTKPLSDEEINQIWTEVTCQEFNVPLSFARAIEAKVRGEKC